MGDTTISGVTNDILKTLLSLRLKEAFNLVFLLRKVEQKIAYAKRQRISRLENFVYQKLFIVFKIFLGELRETKHVEIKASDPIVECLP